MYKTFLLAVLLLLLPLSAIAQEIEVGELSDSDLALTKFMVGRYMRTALEEDPSGLFMFLLTMYGDELLPDFRKEFGITDEQMQHMSDSMGARDMSDPDNMDETVFMRIDAVVEKILDGNYELSEDEDAALEAGLKYTFDEANSVVADALTDEQLQKMDGMILALTGGLESPFFNDRLMTAIDMTDEQKEQYKAINEETKPGREKMIAGVSKKIEDMLKSGKFNFKDIIAVLSQFKEFTGDLKKRRMEVLTAAQIAKVRQLAKLPKSFSLFSLLPQWVPDENSWKPGNPLPEGVKPVPLPLGNFPRKEME